MGKEEKKPRIIKLWFFQAGYDAYWSKWHQPEIAKKHKKERKDKREQK